MSKQLDEIKKLDAPVTQIDLRAREGWFDLDTTLIILAGLVVVVLTALFFSARRLDTQATLAHETTQTSTINAAGVAAPTLTTDKLYGAWQADELTFTFRGSFAVEISDEWQGDLLVGAWEYDEAAGLLLVRLTGNAGETHQATFRSDGSVLILTEQTGDDFAPGLTLQKISS